MTLTSGKHIVEEINGVNCSLVEKGVSADRADFLKRLLEHNGYEVQVAEDKPQKGKKEEEESEEASEPVYKVGVTDITFNPVISVYRRELKALDGKVVLPHYWRHQKHGDEKWYWKEKE